MPDTHFVLARLNWRRTPAGFARLPGETRLASFPTRAAADTEMWKRELAAREVVNPFAVGPAPFEQTSMPAPIFRDWLLDAGIDPPKKFDDPAAWAGWWDRSAKKWSADQRAKVWEALDKVRFHAVTERPKLPVVYAVVSLNWQYNDQYYVCDGEGGKVDEVFRSRKKAENYCEDCEDIARAGWADGLEENQDPAESFDTSSRREALSDPFAAKRRVSGRLETLSQIRNYEVIEIELEGTP